MFKVFAITLRKIVNFSLKFKDLPIKSGLVRTSFILLTSLLFITISSYAQVERPIKNPARPLPVRTDSVKIPVDSINYQADSVQTQNDTIPPPKGDIETTINYSARDSIRATVDGKLIWLYGNAKIKYGSIELEAEQITIDYANNTIEAQGRRDTLGNRIGYPIFKNGAEVYETKGIVYNFKTRRARITEVVTQQGEGYLHSDAAFKNEKNEILSIRNSFTTCNLEHPHFRIRASKTKAIPNDKIVAGPFYMEFNDIPLPAGFLFGMFPAQRESKSGIIFPSYGEERRRGFNLRGGGYFFDISEYIKLAITGDIYSKGGHALYVNSNYMKRYAHNGNFNFSYSKNRLGTNIEDASVSNDFRITWSHTPQSKGTGRFAASVNAATATFNQNNNLMFGATNELYASKFSNISAQLSSSISYNKRFTGTPFSAAINLNHSQNLFTRLVDLSFPTLTVNMTNIYPFQRKGSTGPLDNLSIGYSMAGSNRITNQLRIQTSTGIVDSIAPFNMDNLPMFLDKARKGVRHSVPVSFSFKALRFFTVSPSINYEERWYAERLQWDYDKDANRIYVKDTIPGFNRIGNYSVSASMTTRIYGMYLVKNKNSSIKALRHILTPSVSFSLTPDFTNNKTYFSKLKDNAGNDIYRGNHEGFVYGGSTTGRAGTVGFSLGNNLEMKVKTRKDTVERKVMLLNNLSISSGYNIFADSFKLSTISISAATNILDNTINLSMTASVDPYNYVTVTNEAGQMQEKRVDSYAWKGYSLGRLTTASLGVNTNLNPQKRKKEQEKRDKIIAADIPEGDRQHLLQNPASYIDFEIPWSLNLGYTLSYSHQLNAEARIVQTVNMAGDLSISQKWKITYNSGYHFEEKEFTQTNLGISRDLHCWQMNLQWVPFGRFQSFNFVIAVKASILQDLKLERRKPFMDNL
jgi:hypothetical protein